MEPILHSFAYSLDYLREMIADVPERLLTVQPDCIPNHPAWTIGHLVFIAQAIGGVARLEPWLPDEWTTNFGPGSTPRSEPPASAGGQFVVPADTPEGRNMNVNEREVQSKENLLSALETAQTKLTNSIRNLTDDELDAPFPDPSYADVFPTVRHAFTQVLLGHTAFHIGQVSVWRRAMNLPPTTRSYE